jgi:hypothetical protein
VPELALRGEHSNLEEPTVYDFGVESLELTNPPITELSAPILVQFVPPRVTHHERQIVLQEAMEANVATSSGSSHTPSMNASTGGIPPPNPPSLVWTKMFSTTSTSGSGLIPSTMMTTAPFTQSATGPPFSYGMTNFDTNSVLTYSTLQNMGLGGGILNAPLKGSMGGTSTSYNAIPYSGGLMSPLSPWLSGAFQPPVGPNMNYTLFGVGSIGPSSYTTLVGSMPFSFFDVFGNNSFSSTAILVGGNPSLDNRIVCRVLFLHRGKHRSFILTRTLESLALISSLVRDSDRGQPVPWSMEPRARLYTYAL